MCAMKKTATRETLFMPVYGSKVILPVEVTLHTHWLTTFQGNLNNVTLQKALHLLSFIRGDIYMQESLYKLCLAGLYNHIIKEQLLDIGNLVMRKT